MSVQNMFYVEIEKIISELYHQILLPNKYSGVSFIATDKRGYSHNSFLISLQKHMLWYSLEAPRRGASNEYPQHMFSWRNKDISIFSDEKSALSVAMSLKYSVSLLCLLIHVYHTCTSYLPKYRIYPMYWDTLSAYHTCLKI